MIVSDTTDPKVGDQMKKLVQEVSVRKLDDKMKSKKVKWSDMILYDMIWLLYGYYILYRWWIDSRWKIGK